MQVCTIVARNYLAQARVLGRSLLAADAEATLWVLVVDGHGDEEPLPGTRFVEPEALGLGADLAVMRLIYDVTELSTALKPALLRWLLEQTGGPVTYLDPDIEVFTPLREVDTLAAQHGLVLTPHVLEPLPNDGLQPSTVDILLSGTFNLGFVAVADRDDVRGLLDWWDRTLRRDCIIDHGNGWFVDQRFMDLAPGFVTGHHVLRDPGYNVAYWNLSERQVDRDADGSFTINGRPLRFFHYSGFNPSRSQRISKHQSRYTFADLPEVAGLYARYAESLERENFLERTQTAYRYNTLHDGKRLDRLLRRYLRGSIIKGDLPDDLDGFSAPGAETIAQWIGLLHGTGPLAGVPELIVTAAERRDDVMALFGTDPVGLMDWARRYGVYEFPMFAHVLEGVDVLSPVDDTPPGEPDPGTDEDEGSPVLADPVGAPFSAARYEPPEQLERRFGVNLAGFLRAELGIGEAARNTLNALDFAGIPTAPVEGGFTPNSRHGVALEVVRPSEAPYPVNVICVNPDVLERWVQRTDHRLFEDRYTIGYWWWELQHVPESFLNSLEIVDEIWCGSQFVADAFAAVTDKPVTVVRVPVEVPPPPSMSRAELGLPEGFVFLFLFDFNSSIERKNPLGTIETFASAFAADDGASLVIKTINADKHPESAALLHAAIEGLPHVQLLDRYLEADQRDAMLASVDCYVSLHRSEGLGLTLAESMYLGKPVIATGWSGNLDFMTDENSYLVPYELIDVGDEGGAYPAEGRWADPDLAAAARMMRDVFDHQDQANAKGARAAEDLRRTHSLEAAAVSLATRLGELRLSLGRRELHRVGSDAVERHAVAARNRAGGSPVRRLLMRVLRPYTYHQDRVTEALVSDQAALGHEVADMQREIATLRTDLLRAIRNADRR